MGPSVDQLVYRVQWQSADRFRCINGGLMPQTKPVEMDQDTTDKEKLDYYRSQEKEYRRRMEKARDCLLPSSVHMEVLQMLKDRGKVSVSTKEVVCEVVEGDVTQLVVQFLDKLGNVVEGNTWIPVIRNLDDKNEGGIIVEIKLKELEQAEVSMEWSIVPGQGGSSTLASLQPGWAISIEPRNIQGLNRSILGSMTTSDFINPQMTHATAHFMQTASTVGS
ncbi:hypothetical protein MLD38_017370 [Melastoma candidum]|uniref:Uncharacterized protein n=1 Tax=Melastoma candidum TaxID=119954 RepID=A0ACB9QPU3_9MYRT|nr:hypothetical protein MLD38_017370 [Melastoma candidum]